MKEQAEQVNQLIKAAAECKNRSDSSSAVHFSQAALNCANAMMCIAALTDQFPELRNSTESSDSGGVA